MSRRTAPAWATLLLLCSLPGCRSLDDPAYALRDDDDDVFGDDDDDDDDGPPTGPGCAGAVLNELQDGADDPIEIYNPTDEEIDLGACGVVDDSPGRAPYLIPTRTRIEPGEFFVLRKGEHHDFGLSDEDTVVLLDVDGEVLDEAGYGSGEALVSFCRFPDGTGPWQQCARASLGSPNVLQYSNTVVQPLFIAGLDRWDEDVEGVEGPNELGYDRNGNLWVGDQGNRVLKVYRPDGSYLRTVGEGDFPADPAGDDRHGPEAIRVDENNHVFVVDRAGDRVHVYDADSFTRIDTFAEDADYEDLVGLALDGDRVILADQGTDRLEAWSKDGEPLFEFDTERGGEDLFDVLETLTVDREGRRLFASSEDLGRVQVFDLDDGDYLGGACEPQTLGTPQPGRVADVVEGIFFDPSHEWLFVSDEQNQRFMVLDASGPSLFEADEDYGFLGSFGQGGDGPGQFISADGVTVDPQRDRVAIADQGNDRVQVFRLSDIARALGL